MPLKQDSLLKYDPPVLSGAEKKTTKGKTGRKLLPPVGKGSSAASAPDDVLNEILPPRIYQDGDKTWIQHVSTTPATRMDVINLQHLLQKRLKERQAREIGICAVREELYAQCFDELIRQTTVGCSERGVLLTKIRDEIRMTVLSYRTLYESAVAYGMRKALLAEQAHQESEKRVAQLEQQRDDLEKQTVELRARLEESDRREAERRAMEEKKHGDEVDFLKKQVSQLKQQLETLLSV
ncbi:Axonemal dynein light intermediate polypeptide 1 [Aduncisulcus paluster]|uniref:Axonemal dynein light intermediate polypeptide 1 n=1 Tax=Aduncisulcus paluster TaxID=2918883 RepID=A0ABQ5KXR1_9EUKA|nr:Axonemal dynein light intermediate polypeptide 1 [Aduncisulcus paluster]|eukprot:gnl/Carplike_NY0171/2487_a3343_810.p1 GENE.gnl/Carplike_NY0171/2487_a3343_810~~gnl/Carplike_NY0171/2487_a3343_810.p1  ORF type:complete len:238 (-),score=48.71 gnl/Carplike_NY0171/2487_a3343_810:93-806(-)